MKKYFKDWSNFISFALALIPAILLYIFQPSDSVPYIVFVITFLLAFMFAWLAFKLYWDLRDKSNSSPIELIGCKNNRILCKPNPFLIHHSIVSLYIEINGFEELLTHGYVESITNKGLIQIMLFSQNKNWKKHFTYIQDHQNSIIIKPTVTYEKLNELIEEDI